MKTRNVIAALAVVALTPTAAAQAQTVDRGSTTFELSKAGANALKKAGVTVAVGRPARRVSTATVFPVSRGILSGTRYLEHDGTLSFSRRSGGRTRKVTFRALRTTLSSTRAAVSGEVGGKRVSLLSLSARKPLVSSADGTVRLAATKATLTLRAATLVRAGLKLRTLSRALGTVSVNAALRGRTSTTSPSSTPGTTTPGTTTPGTSTPAPGGGTPSNTKVFVEPPLLAKPADASAVGAPTSFDFAVRPSWLEYLAGGDGESDGTVVGDGATESGASGAGDWNRNFQFPHAGPSWATPANAAGLYFGGSLRFTFPQHQIEILLKNPEIELNGAASRLIFRVDGSAITAQSRGKRAALFNLNLAGVTDSDLSPFTTTYANVPVTVTADAADGVFGGMYEPGSDYGTMTVSFTR